MTGERGDERAVLMLLTLGAGIGSSGKWSWPLRGTPSVRELTVEVGRGVKEATAAGEGGKWKGGNEGGGADGRAGGRRDEREELEQS